MKHKLVYNLLMFFMILNVLGQQQKMRSKEEVERQIKEIDSMIGGMERTKSLKYDVDVKNSVRQKLFSYSNYYKNDLLTYWLNGLTEWESNEYSTDNKIIGQYKAYCKLIIKCETATNDTDVYLNQRKLCKFSEANSGLILHSKKEYTIQIRNQNTIFCDLKFISSTGGLEYHDCDIKKVSSDKRKK